MIFLAALLAAPIASAQTISPADPATASPARVDAAIAATFAGAAVAWMPRVTQDETQRLCSLRRNEPTQAEADSIVARESATLVMPAETTVLGNWRNGEKIAQNGQGGQFSDAPGTVSGGNCYACHQMAPAEISYGTLGPSLAGYGRLHDFKPEAARAAYAKVYNPQSALACSSMPRFGHNKILTEHQIKDIVAFLFAPESPVNAP